MSTEQIVMNNGENQPKGKIVGREILEWVACIAVALVITFILRNFVFTLVKVDGASMNPTLQNGERLVMIRLGYKPKVGDVVVVNPGNNSKAPYIKRVIALPGDQLEFKTVEAKNEKGMPVKKVEFYINGEKQNEPYIRSSNRYSDNGIDCYANVIGQGVFTVPDEHIFVMGDNRTNSTDSRSSSVGFIPYENVLGHASFRIWPLNQIGKP